ncbi:hypothetical protein [Tritonibacter scottomollicae]|uniref:hypothetical protein n=1 Tax=Tritonibacter scottomollicae TaxID=483013 RepID=UPI003AA8AAA3
MVNDIPRFAYILGIDKLISIKPEVLRKSAVWGDVDELWEKLFKDFSPERQMFVPRHEPNIKTPARLLIFARENSGPPILGPVMRMAILTALAEEKGIVRGKRFSVASLSDHFGEPYGQELEKGPAYGIARPTFVRDGTWAETWAMGNPLKVLPKNVLPLLELFLRLVNEEFRKDKDALTIRDVWQSEYAGREALAEFVDLVTGTWRLSQPFLPRSSFLSIKGGTRSGLLGHMIDWAGGGRKSPDNQPMVQNIYSQDMRVGLSAFGGHLAQELKTKLPTGTEVLHLPLLPFAEAHQGKLPHQYGLVDFAGLLEHFYTHTEPAVERLVPMPSYHSFDTSLANIRTAMVKQPRVLIIDGVNVVSEDNLRHQLERFVDGNTVLGVLARLVEAPLSRLESGKDLDAFARNRILILSGGPIVKSNGRTGKEISMPFLTARPGRSIDPQPLPLPAEDDGEEIIKSHNFAHQEEILALRAASPTLYQSLRDLEYFALDAYFGLEPFARDGGRKGRQALAAELSGDLPRGKHVHIILYAAMKGISPERRLLRGLLFLLTLSPDGLRQDTLIRAAEYHLYIERTGGSAVSDMTLGICDEDVAEYRRELGQLQADEPDGEIVQRALQDLLEAMPTVLHRTSGDFVPGVDSGAEGLELFESEATWRRGLNSSSTEAVGFTMPEYRHKLQEILVAELGEDAYRIACRILSLIALRQQAVVFRHEGIPEGQMLRPWRRQVTAILLGLQSLPVILEPAPGDGEKTARAKIDDRYDDLFHNVSIQYRTSERFYTWLYFFAYRQQIERPPAQNLSRLYGLNRFKSRLLDAFEQPWLLTEDLFPKAHTLDERNLFKDVHGEGSAQYALAIRKDAVIQHLLARIVAHTATGDEDGARSALSALRELPMAPDNRHEGFKLRMAAMRRQIDVGILSEDDRQETLRHMNHWAVEENGSDWPEMNPGVLAGPMQASPDELMKWPPQLMGVRAFKELDNLIKKISMMFYEHLGDPHNAPFDRRRLVNLLDGAELKILRNMSGPWAEFLCGDEGMSDLSDLLYRIAEMINLGAENAMRPEMQTNGDAEAHTAEDFALKTIFTSDPYSYWSIMKRHCCALAIFQVAEKLRLLVFERAPTSRNFFASGHSMREMILLARFLENQRRLLLSKSAAAEPVSETDQIFVRIARDGSLALSRHLFRYPGERGSMMLMEAAILRMVARRPAPDEEPGSEAFRYRERALYAARSYLVRAEDLLLSRGSSSRRRLRLSLERCALHMDLARFHSRTGDYDKVEFFRNLASLDLQFLEKRTERLGLARNWRKIYNLQQERFVGLVLLTEDWMKEIEELKAFAFGSEICRQTCGAAAVAHDKIRMRNFDFNQVRDFLGGCAEALHRKRERAHGKKTVIAKIDEMLERCDTLQGNMRECFESFDRT